jgi:hypothetical protein
LSPGSQRENVLKPTVQGKWGFARPDSVSRAEEEIAVTVPRRGDIPLPRESSSLNYASLHPITPVTLLGAITSIAHYPTLYNILHFCSDAWVGS